MGAHRWPKELDNWNLQRITLRPDNQPSMVIFALPLLLEDAADVRLPIALPYRFWPQWTNISRGIKRTIAITGTNKTAVLSRYFLFVFSSFLESLKTRKAFNAASPNIITVTTKMLGNRNQLVVCNRWDNCQGIRHNRQKSLHENNVTKATSSADRDPREVEQHITKIASSMESLQS